MKKPSLDLWIKNRTSYLKKRLKDLEREQTHRITELNILIQIRELKLDDLKRRLKNT